MPTIELIWPGQEKSPVDSILQRMGNAIYHLCYTTPDCDQTLAAFSAEGLRVLPIGDPAPAVLFGGKTVSFYNVAGFGLIELLES